MIQVGKALSATVVATARSDVKARFCRDQGADHVLDLDDAFSRDELDRITATSTLMRDCSALNVLSAFRDDGEMTATVDALTRMLASERIGPPVTTVHPFDRVPTALAERAEGGVGQAVISIGTDSG